MPTLQRRYQAANSGGARRESVYKRLGRQWSKHPKTVEVMLREMPGQFADALAEMAKDDPTGCEQLLDRMMSVAVGLRYEMPEADLKKAEVKADAFEDLAEGMANLEPTEAREEEHIRALIRQSSASAALARYKRAKLEARRRALEPAH